MTSDASCTATVDKLDVLVPNFLDLTQQLAQYLIALRPTLASEFAVTQKHDVRAENVISFFTPSGFQFYKLETTPQVVRDLLRSPDVPIE